MSFFEIVLISVGLAMDAGAVSMAAAAAGYAQNKRAVFRLSFHFGLFQCLMPVLGWYLGVGFVSYIRAWDHWVAFLLLAFIGVRMVREGCGKPEEISKKDPSRGMTMVMLSVATSIDALAVGLSFAVLDISIFYPAVMIGVITSIVSLAAITLGRKLGQVLGKRMEIAGGLVLIGIGLKILISRYC